MWKEVTICVSILVIIIVGNCITQNYTKQSFEDVSGKLEELREELSENQDDIDIRKSKKKDGRYKKRLGK